MRKLAVVPGVLIAACISGNAYAQSAVQGQAPTPQAQQLLTAGKLGGQQGQASLSDQQLNQLSGSGASGSSQELLNAENLEAQGQAGAQSGVTQAQASPTSNQNVNQGLAGLQVGLSTMGQALGRVF